MTKKYSQVVVRFTVDLEKKIKKEAEKIGLTKAAWLRKLAIETLNKKD